MVAVGEPAGEDDEVKFGQRCLAIIDEARRDANCMVEGIQGVMVTVASRKSDDPGADRHFVAASRANPTTVTSKTSITGLASRRSAISLARAFALASSAAATCSRIVLPDRTRCTSP